MKCIYSHSREGTYIALFSNTEENGSPQYIVRTVRGSGLWHRPEVSEMVFSNLVAAGDFYSRVTSK